MIGVDVVGLEELKKSGRGRPRTKLVVTSEHLPIHRVVVTRDGREVCIRWDGPRCLIVRE